MSGEIDISTYQFEGRLSGQLLGPDNLERTDLPISTRFQNGEALQVMIGDGVAEQLFRIIELHSR